MKPLRSHREAREEIREAVRYHEKAGRGSGKKVRQAMESALQRIKQSPRAFPRYGDSAFRKCVLSKFRYTIFFAELDDCVWVAAVAHQSRQPDYWMDRTTED